jgi:anti-anti-sigma factor
VQSQFRVEVERQGRAAVIAVTGELDLVTGPQLEAELHDISVSDTELVVVDLHNLEFMDSTGLSIIVRAHQRLTREGCKLGLVRGSPQVQRLLDLTGVADRIALVTGPEDLIDAQ